MAVRGHVDERFTAVEKLLARFVDEDPGFSAQVAITYRGESVVDLAGGSALSRESLTGVYSVSKGMAALTIAELVERGELDLDAPVSEVWPEFAAHGKGVITTGDLLAHRGGVPALAGATFALEDVLEHSERPSAIGAVGSPRGLARLYADALPGSATPIAGPETFRAMSAQRSWGHDRVLDATNCFGTVFLLPQPRLPFGSLGAFGHDGMGGALAFADPAHELSFGYIPWPLQHHGGADRRAVILARAAQGCIRGDDLP